MIANTKQPRGFLVLKWLLYSAGGLTALFAAYTLLTAVSLAGSDAAIRATLMWVTPQLSDLLVQIVQSFLVPAAFALTILLLALSLLLFAVGKLSADNRRLDLRIAELERVQKVIEEGRFDFEA